MDSDNSSQIPGFTVNSIFDELESESIRELLLDEFSKNLNLLFNIFLCNLFLFLLNIEIRTYANDNTPYAENKSNNEVVQDIKNGISMVFYLVSK